MLPSSIYVAVLETSDDAVHPLVDADVPFYTCNLHCYTNAMKYGNYKSVDGIIYPTGVAWLNNGNLRDIVCKNAVAGSNGKVIAIATVPTTFTEQALGV